MTIPRLAAITKHQKVYPPVYWLVAQYMGYGPKEGSQAAAKTGLNEDGESLFDMFPVKRG